MTIHACIWLKISRFSIFLLFFGMQFWLFTFLMNLGAVFPKESHVHPAIAQSDQSSLSARRLIKLRMRIHRLI